MRTKFLAHVKSPDDSGVWESMLPAGFSFTGAGSVRVAGLDVMGARVFDGVSKRFLSTDPLAQVPGTGFFADVYAFCGNNPVGLMDPWGLKPMSPDEFQKYSQEQYNKALKNIRDYAMAGVAIVAGAVLSTLALTGPWGIIFGAAGGALLGAGTEMLMQKLEGKEELDWGAIGREALIGGVSGLAGGVAATGMKAFGNAKRFGNAAETVSKGVKAGQELEKTPMQKALTSSYSLNVAKNTAYSAVNTAETYRYNAMANGTFNFGTYLGAGFAGGSVGFITSATGGAGNYAIKTFAPGMGKVQQTVLTGGVNATNAVATANINLGMNERFKSEETRKSQSDIPAASLRSSGSGVVKSASKDFIGEPAKEPIRNLFKGLRK